MKSRDPNSASDLSFEAFAPCPQELKDTPAGPPDPDAQRKIDTYGYANWYDWQVAHWGSKWDVEAMLTCPIPTEPPGDTVVVTMNFDSAWSPPVSGIDLLATMWPALHFHLEYDEPGMDFWGETVWVGGIIVHEEDGPSKSNAEWMANNYRFCTPCNELTEMDYDTSSVANCSTCGTYYPDPEIIEEVPA